jgi:N-methylhydantoinase A
MMHLGVDVGGTFTDLVGWDGRQLRVVKLPSSPPAFHTAVLLAVARAAAVPVAADASVVHGSTVATNALLQRAGEPIAFVTTDGFRDMLLIGRQNRPRLYALRVERPAPLVSEEHCFTVRERIDAAGRVVEPLNHDDVAGVIASIRGMGLKHVAVCLLFSFANPVHEREIGERCRAAGLTVSLSSELLPEFREYERASTTAVNAALRPTVETYLGRLESGLRAQRRSCELRIMHSGGGTLTTRQACEQAARLVLSGPAGGVIGAAHVARLCGLENVITYDMGGTSTDVATVIEGRPRWTTATTIDGLPIGLPMFDIQSIGAGGGSIARIDPGGALRVGPQSAGALPGPACYGRGGQEPTVTDANVVLGRIPGDLTLGGEVKIDGDLAARVFHELAGAMGCTPIQAALGVVRVAESNMARAVSAVTSRRGQNPRDFTLVSFGGAGGLHACALADELDIRQILVPPLAGVLSALGMVVAPPVSDVSATVLQLDEQLDDARLAREFDTLAALSAKEVAAGDIELFADVRFAGQSHELTVRVIERRIDEVRATFLTEYERAYGPAPRGRRIQIVTLRVRRTGPSTVVELPSLAAQTAGAPRFGTIVRLTDHEGAQFDAPAAEPAALAQSDIHLGPMLITDPRATTYVPGGWSAQLLPTGAVLLKKCFAARQ